MSCATTADLKATCVGEFIGTFLLVLFGTATVAALPNERSQGSTLNAASRDNHR